MQKRPSTNEVNVHSFGARGDGQTDDSTAIQQALDSGNARVVIPKGTYCIAQTLRIASNTQLQVHAEACLRLADGAGTNSDVFLITNADSVSGNNNIEICGGIWDGNNAHNPRGPDAPDSYTGVALSFSKVHQLTLRNLQIRDAESYSIRISEVRNFCFETVRFEAQSLRPNQDGIHLCGGCEDGVIRDISARGFHCTNDDLIALLADDAMDRAQNLGGKCGPISRIRIENLSADDCHSFVRLGSVWSSISDIEIRDIHGGFRFNVINADALRYCKVPVFDTNDPRFKNGVGLLENIRISDVNVHRNERSEPMFQLETRMKNFQIQNFSWDLEKEIHSDAATLRIRNILCPKVTLDGLKESEIQQLSAQFAETHFQTIPSATSQAERHCAELKLSEGMTCELRCGSLAHLEIAHCENHPLPPPEEIK